MLWTFQRVLDQINSTKHNVRYIEIMSGELKQYYNLKMAVKNFKEYAQMQSPYGKEGTMYVLQYQIIRRRMMPSQLIGPTIR